MKTKRVLRYWCDYCNKGGQSKHAMMIHEKHCTMNPERECRVCGLIGNNTDEHNPAELAKLLPSVINQPNEWGHNQPAPDGDIKQALKELRNACDGCPACILAALRQAGIPPWATFEIFDFKKEMKSILDDVNEERHSHDY